MKRGMRDNETTLKLMWKTSKEVKNHGPTTNKNSIMKINHGVQGWYNSRSLIPHRLLDKHLLTSPSRPYL